MRELDRRNSESTSRPSCTRYRESDRPFTRRFVADLKSKHLVQDTFDFLGRCGPECLQEIEQFSKHGGPDLSDLRGVRNHYVS